LLSHGESLHTLGTNFDLNGACFHGTWQLCQFLVEQGADVNWPLLESGESLLHSTLVKANGPRHNLVLETGAFMRDCRTKGETPLHRAPAFGDEEAIQLLLDAGAVIDARDMHGDTPLSWAGWYLRPAPILRKLCQGSFGIRPNYAGMEANLRGNPHT
jgi:ankyrin repeat protein